MSFELDLFDVKDHLQKTVLELGQLRSAFEDLVGWEMPVKRLENALHHLRTTETSIDGYLESRPSGFFERKQMDDFVLMIAKAAQANGHIVSQLANEALESLKDRNA